MSTYVTTQTQTVTAANDIDYAYRGLGADDGTPPLVLLQHFRGNLDNWDPALVDALAEHRRVITFDNTGVGASTGRTPHSIAEMAGVGRTKGRRPAGRREPGPQTSPQGYLSVFFTSGPVGREAWQAAAQRIFGGRTEGRDQPTTWDTRLAQYDAVVSWGIPNHALLERVSAITQPVFVANGDSDRMILPRYSHLLAGLLPNATIKIYPDAAHGFLFQHHEEFADDVAEFLSR